MVGCCSFKQSSPRRLYWEGREEMSYVGSGGRTF